MKKTTLRNRGEMPDAAAVQRISKALMEKTPLVEAVHGTKWLGQQTKRLATMIAEENDAAIVRFIKESKDHVLLVANAVFAESAWAEPYSLHALSIVAHEGMDVSMADATLFGNWLTFDSINIRELYHIVMDSMENGFVLKQGIRWLFGDETWWDDRYNTKQQTITELVEKIKNDTHGDKVARALIEMLGSKKDKHDQSDRRAPTANSRVCAHSVTSPQIVDTANNGISNPQFVDETIRKRVGDVFFEAARHNETCERVVGALGTHGLTHEAKEVQAFSLEMLADISNHATYGDNLPEVNIGPVAPRVLMFLLDDKSTNTARAKSLLELALVNRRIEELNKVTAAIQAFLGSKKFIIETRKNSPRYHDAIEFIGSLMDRIKVIHDQEDARKELHRT